MIIEAAKKEFAPGIPKKERILPIPSIDKPQIWTHNLQHHIADKAGPHYDFRLADKEGNSHSWALRTLPIPGEKMLAVQQPTHSKGYLGFEGTIESGYGKGEVKSIRLEPTDVVKAGPERITFHLHKGHDSEEFTLIHLKEKAWLLVNHTATRKSKPELPDSKPKYKEIPWEKIKERLPNPDEIISAKVDGAHVLYGLETGKPLRAYSYRPTKRDTGLIEHTHRVPNMYQTRVPPGFDGTILRGELYARDKSGKGPLPSEIIGGMLNSNVWLSREKQKINGKLRPLLFDVVKWKGKDVSNAPYADKMEMIKKVKQALPIFELPDMAQTLSAKEKLVKAISKETHPQTSEGVVIWNTKQGVPPTKAKRLEEQDVTIKGFAPGEGALKGKGIGAIYYGTTEDKKEIKGKVGTGLSRSLREHMHKNPELYIGKVMKTKSQGKFPSGALRSPRFLSMHLDSLEGGEKVAANPDWVQLHAMRGLMSRGVPRRKAFPAAASLATIYSWKNLKSRTPKPVPSEVARMIQLEHPKTASMRDELEKIAKLGGRSLRLLRTMMAGGHPSYGPNIWGHGTTRSGLEGILQHGLMPATTAAKKGILTHIEGTSRLTQKEVKQIARGGYRSVVKKRSPNRSGEGASQQDVVSFLPGQVPAGRDFGRYALIGKMRQLGVSKKKIIEEELTRPHGRGRDVPYLERKLKLPHAFEAQFRPAQLPKEERRGFMPTSYGRGSSLEQSISKSRPIRVIPEQNIVLAPKRSVNTLRQKYKGINVVPREDFEKGYPSGTFDYSKAVHGPTRFGQKKKLTKISQSPIPRIQPAGFGA